MTNADLLYFNGVNGATGQYLLPPMTRDKLAERFIIGAQDPENLPELKWRYDRKMHSSLGVPEGVDPTKLDQAGWGIIFAADQDRVPAIMEALKPLLDLRRSQVGPRYKEYTGADGFQGPNDSKTRFLMRQKVGPGPACPNKVPYYLLIVGDPQAIPYSFQYQLDVQYAVGRIHFNTLDEYAQYASSVVMAETGKVALPRRAAFFGVQNLDDPATAMSATQLVAPLAKQLAISQSDWAIETVLAAEAKKARLTQLLGGADTPALLFTASHGMYFPPDDLRKRQLPHQGALLCGDWRGPQLGPSDIPQDYYLAADDVGDDARLLGMIAFHFACFGAGTPQLDDYAQAAPAQRVAIAPQAFVAQLPRRLLSHPKGGALAVIGHIERAFPCSFTWDQAGAQLTTFDSTLRKIMHGQPVGYAVEYFNERYSELSTVLSEALGDIGFGKRADLQELTGMWMANNDARNYVIIGDPAVRLPLAENGAASQRPIIAPVAIRGSAIAAQPQANPPPVTPAPSPPPPAAPPAAPNAGNGSGGSVFDQFVRMPGFTPWPLVPAEADKQQHPELYAAWVQHIQAGYKNSDSLFSQILQAFMRSHYSTVAMYWVLFAMGVGFFITGIVLAVQKGESVTGLVFGGLSVVSFLTYFITRPSQTIEENLLYITWLGMLYNSYWTHLNWSSDAQTAQAELDTATASAITQIKELIASHAATVKQRPGLLNIGSGKAQDAPAGSAGEPGQPSAGSS